MNWNRGRVALAGTLMGLLALPAAAQGQQRTIDVLAFPSPETATASPRTQISFRNVTRTQLGTVTVTGSRSGRHGGTLRAHSDGDGASFVPARNFRGGERVTVRIGPRGRVAHGDGRTFGFKIARHVEGFATMGEAGAPAGAGKFARLRSRPDLAPPTLGLHVSKPEATAPGFVFIGPKRGPGQGGPMIVSNAGKPVWFHPLPEGVRANDFRVQRYQGKPVLTWWEGAARGGSGRGDGIIANTRYDRIARVRAGNGYKADMHEFLLTDRGTALLCVYQKVRRDLSEVGSYKRGVAVDSIVQEIDIKTGLVMFEWHSIGNVPLKDSNRPKPVSRNEGYDYFHINSVEPDGAGGYIVSARTTSAVYRISPSGKVLWTLGGKRSTFKLGEGVRFDLQHDARLQDDGTIRIFDNSAEGIRKASREIAVRLDMKAKTASLVWSFAHPANVLAATQGNGHTLPNGNVFVGWGSQRRVSEFAPDGSLVFDLTLPHGFDTYRGYRAEWKGTPRRAPQVVAAARKGGRTAVYASWNGSTEIRAWRVLAGASADALTVQKSQPVGGLETAISVATTARHVAVEALDRDGKVLRRSATVRVQGR